MFGWLNQINRRNQMNQTDKITRTLRQLYGSHEAPQQFFEERFILLEVPIDCYGRALVIGVHRKIAILDHSNPQWAVSNKSAREGLTQAPLGRMA